LSQDDIEEGKIAMNKGTVPPIILHVSTDIAVARGNCAIKLADLVHVSPANDIKYGKR
jgi:transitional endoplasmic reticulum ATPase